MYNYIDDAIQNCYLDPKTAKFVVTKMNWDVSKLKHQFKQLSGGQSLNRKIIEPPTIDVTDFLDYIHDECQVCYEEVELLATTCGHNLCYSCWGHYLRAQIKDENNFPVNCFGVKCQGIVSETIVNIVLEWDEDTLTRYRNAGIRGFVEVSAMIIV